MYMYMYIYIYTYMYSARSPRLMFTACLSLQIVDHLARWRRKPRSSFPMCDQAWSSVACGSGVTEPLVA